MPLVHWHTMGVISFVMVIVNFFKKHSGQVMVRTSKMCYDTQGKQFFFLVFELIELSHF